MIARISAHCWVGLLLAFVLIGVPWSAPAQAAAPSQWTLTDTSNTTWQLAVFERDGWRLRLTSLNPSVSPDHTRPLLVTDGLHQHWTLDNCSKELVPEGQEVLPRQSAQFDLAELKPVPEAFLPLQLNLPLEQGSSQILLGAEQVTRLHQISLEPVAR